MSISTTKLLKVGGPALTGIGGVIATSSLVSKSAEEKPEERFKTAALKDDEPSIKEWKDRNESDQEGNGEGSGEPGSTSEEQPSSSKGDQASSDNGKEGVETSDKNGDDQDSASTSPDDKGEGENSDDESTSEEGTESEISSTDDSSGTGVTENGSADATYNHASGTAYGTRNEAMTRQEFERTVKMKDDLTNLRDQLSSLFNT
ncbi:hypothetical protein MHC_03940 [Mycoplasma haemocanis str. Illinois]|uniref:Uncharacterized protein n=1 Tax=Mycoplasma haemocanis (strain Illinois) TaxID=1111676 RepID=H6N7M4_MYCHN|nr:hypothetical protein [Mycoplasma haemocanis]AEW45646.1 hypothetical protein MHC_03940 [Mycoplasma haemocanis str. Illinois]